MKRLILLLLTAWAMPGLLNAQHTLSGKITDRNLVPLPGASVRLQGQYAGCISGKQGEFSLNHLKTGNYILEVSYLGFADFTREITLNGDLFLDIQLLPSAVMQDEVIISATRAGENEPSTLTNINRMTIEKYNTGQDIPYILSTTPSFVASSDAGNGVGYTSLRIRGSDITRINVTINGIPYNDQESQGVFWVNIPDLASSIDNIQIQRGIGTSTNGSAAFGASINIQTDKLRAQPYAEYSGSYGSFDSWKNTLMAGTGLLAGHWAFDARLSKISSDGYIDRGSSDLKSFFVSGGYYGEKTILKAVIFSGLEKTYQCWQGVPKDSLATNRRYNPFTYENQTDNYQQDNYQLLFSREIGRRFLLNAALHYTYGRGYYEEWEEKAFFSDYNLPDAVIGTDTIATTPLVRRKWLENHFYGFTFSGTYDNRKNLKIIIGGAGNQYLGDHFGKVIWAEISVPMNKDYQWYNNHSVKNDLNVYTRFNVMPGRGLNAYLDLQYRLVQFNLNGIDSRLRDITQRHIFHFFNPKLGLTWDVNEKNRVYIAFGMANREPNGNNFADANPAEPAPVPEQMINAETGYTFSSPLFTTTVNGWLMLYRNQLVLTGEINEVGYPVMTNVPRSYRAGLELSAAARIFRILTWEVNASLSLNKIMNFKEFIDDWDNGGQIVNETGTTNIAFSPGLTAANSFSVKVFKGFDINLITRFVSRQYIDNTSDKSRSLDPYCVSDLMIRYTIGFKILRELGISFSLNNVFNSLYESNAWVYRYYYEGRYQQSDGYFPQAGINFNLGVNLKF